jgi:hypothetical protein
MLFGITHSRSWSLLTPYKCLAPVLFVAAYPFLSLMLGTDRLAAACERATSSACRALVATVPPLFLPMLIAEPHSPVAQLLTRFRSCAATLVFLALDPTGHTRKSWVHGDAGDVHLVVGTRGLAGISRAC